LNNLTSDSIYSILSSSNIGICILDEKGCFIDSTQTFIDIFACDKKELKSRTLSSLFIDDYSYKTWFNDFFIRVQKDTIISNHYDFFNLEKQQLWCRFSMHKDSISNYIILSIQDDTEQKESLEKAYAQVDLLQNIKQYYIESAMEKTQLLKTQDSLMINQAKLAAMGEMIGAIAHQWKQPLAKINSIVIDIQTLFSGERKTQLLGKKLDQIEELTMQMADTIEDFRNYINPQKHKEIFTFDAIFHDAFKMFSSAAESNNIQINTDFIEEISLYGYKKEFIQALLIFFNNSKDAFKDNNISNPIIQITTQQIRNNKIIKITDNGGGIKEEILKEVFEPYFSTKKHKGGTGLGLYMAKLLIEDSMHGKLKIASIHNTTEISIIFLGLKNDRKKI
jgi:C4-dicarboxylate-specific signal transduction histidine kinase